MGFVRPTREEAKNRIEDLVKKFDKNKLQYLASSYDETNVRIEFIDKLFEALGWDISNEKGATNDKKEVLREEDLKMNNATKHPDYAFNDRGQVLFYVEAKKPSVDIKDDKAPAYQLRRYGWNKKLAISILTDFEEFAVYDVSKQPKASDKTTTGRIKFITYDKYIDNFDFLYDTFSWSAVYDKGTFDDYVATFKIKGTEEIDNKLLDTITEWRQNLAKRISLDNNLNVKELNIAVQKIIDRILFLRIAEDKQIEQYRSLQLVLNNENIYKYLVKRFNEADSKYNSGLFKREKWIDELSIDDKVLRDIIISMYPDGDCPYEWSILPIEILGNIYEKFLGSEIVLKNVAGGKTTASIEEKPEVKKAGGVYYTPKYIVDYIVKETVGKKLENATIKDADKLKILDMACGSGSFLIGAYKYLLDWYFNQYTKEESKYLKKKVLVKTNNGIQLSIEEKKRILINNIYGVDIDYQAVEVTKLSLFLQMLDKQGKLIGKKGQIFLLMQSDDAILPNLSNNIKCGNSLVDSSVYVSEIFDNYSSEQKENLHAFNWNEQFSSIMKMGGFDIIIGNPPYIFARDSKGKGIDDSIKEYYITNYNVAKYQINLYHLFIERASRILNTEGLFSYIVPNNWLTINTNEELRKFVLNKSDVSIVNLLYKVFDGANVDNTIVTFNNKNSTLGSIKLIESPSLNKFEEIGCVDKNEILSTNKCIINFSTTKNKDTSYIIEKIEKQSKKLGEVARVKAGLQAYEVGKGAPKCTEKMKNERVYHSRKKISKEYIKYLQGEDVCRYAIKWSGEYLKYGKNLAAPRKFDLFSKPRILVRQIPSKPPYCINASYTDEILLNDRNSMNIVDISINCYYLLAVLNSKLISYWFIHKFNKLSRGLFPQFKVNELADFPIKIASEDNIKNAEKLVKKINALCGEAKYENEINALNKEIDKLIYDVYGLNDKEIAEIEK